uniref:Uncharacterized protein n=1 Tax=Marseillevirus LCMAC103 TaxID=2506604 RepID=A0A481YU69_9VIRU|nr:MAG: hypothetical protein LCMAC103_00790 [Marseillevirus LCMAC103]
MPDRLAPAIGVLLVAFLVAALLDIVAHRCAGVPPTVTLVLIVALAFPLLLARSARGYYAASAKRIYEGVFKFGVVVVVAAAGLSLADAHKRPFGVYAGVSFAVLFAAYLVHGGATSGFYQLPGPK